MTEPSAEPLPPTRAEVAAQWRALIDGETTREAVHTWTVPWVEGEGASTEPLVSSALVRLHGFDLCRADPNRPDMLRHGASGEGAWLHSPEHITAEFARWQAECVRHDADPAAWRRAVRERVRRLMNEEKTP